MHESGETLAAIYAGPFEEFVKRRDAVAKQLRLAKDASGAAAVKALKKPSRAAWALDLGAVECTDALDSLTAAVAGTLEAQTSGGDVRAAIASLRSAVREFAAKSSAAASEAGQAVDAATLASALLAVLGRPDSFRQLCGGYLADIPDAGSLDFLDALPALLPAERSRPQLVKSAPSRKKQESAKEAAAREAARRAEEALAEARREQVVADSALRSAESSLADAEARLREAEQDVIAAREAHTRAGQMAEQAAARVQEAEKTVATP